MIISDASAFLYEDRYNAELRRGRASADAWLVESLPPLSTVPDRMASTAGGGKLTATTLTANVNSNNNNNNNNPLTPLYTRLAASLTRLAETFLCPIICAQRSLAVSLWTNGSRGPIPGVSGDEGASVEGGSVAVKSLLPSVWENMMNVRLVVGLDKVGGVQRGHGTAGGEVDNVGGGEKEKEKEKDTPVGGVRLGSEKRRRGWIRMNAWDSTGEDRRRDGGGMERRVGFWLGDGGVDWFEDG